MKRIPETEIEQIKANIDLVDFVRSRGIKLKKLGNNFIGRCPFHEEENDSFTVTPSKNLWNCFGCGRAGNVIQLVQFLDNISFPEAVAKLTKTSSYKAPDRATKTAAKKKISSLNST